ncbi:Zn-dependent hydrolase [Sporolactobacillus sp. CPB3-1]|uniref:Zn-dependent hydrolase n=1 Tax=Sporolactobacillus mangiferae TaxID=2940498 RepID=A0ABT0M9N6_9BACL|nr:Zn-dependent hydrolase [Sporolactobacillus mangiferae]MCL1631582.1 Zn-dependent hydrolase [Sporolactobacillus mangiferae]
MQKQKIRINEERLKNTIERFADFGRTEHNGVTRLSLSTADIDARNYLISCCKALGMSVKVDDVANIYATMAGTEDHPPLVMGSHLDSVRRGGRFDGALGVIAALEVARTLHDHQIKPKIPFTLVDFTNEEGARFDPAMMCSGIISGKFEKRAMLNSTDSDGVTFGEALAASGYEGDASHRLNEATAYLEMHIEQGPVLENEGLSLGVVEGVVGMVNYEIELTGESDHAGTTPMHMRKDALFAAVDVIGLLRKQLDTLDHELVYTMGRMQVSPNIHTVIPGRVAFTLEARHKDPDVVAQVVRAIRNLPESLDGCRIHARKLWERNTVAFDHGLCDRLIQSARELGLSYKRMYSGAGHDAQYIADGLPAAMLFVPSVKGKSHCEDEFTAYEDCARGVNVAFDTVLSILTEA